MRVPSFLGGSRAKFPNNTKSNSTTSIPPQYNVDYRNASRYGDLAQKPSTTAGKPYDQQYNIKMDQSRQAAWRAQLHALNEIDAIGRGDLSNFADLL